MAKQANTAEELSNKKVTLTVEELNALIDSRLNEKSDAKAAARIDDGKVARISKSAILSELERKPEDDVFYIFGMLNSYGGKLNDAYKFQHPTTQHVKNVSAWKYEFDRHYGVGADLRDAKNESRFNIGRMKVSDQQKVRIDAESIGDLWIGENYQKKDAKTGMWVPKFHRAGDYGVKELIEVIAMQGPDYIYDGESFPPPAFRWITEATFLKFMKIVYEAEWEKREAEESAAQKWQLSTKAEKALGREPAVLAGA